MWRARSRPLRFDRVDLHAGPDIEHAFDRSVVVAARSARAATAVPSEAPVSAGSPVQAFPAAPTVPLEAPERAADRLRRVLRSAADVVLKPETLLVTGREATSGSKMSVLFRGRAVSLDFCARHIFGTDVFDVLPLESAAEASSDVVAVDHPLLRSPASPLATLVVDPWIRQRCVIEPDWARTLSLRPRSLRKELGRMLRQSRCTVRVDSAEAADRSFYDEIYVPYIRSRFGRNAVMPDRRAFARESRDGVLLTLRRHGLLSAGALLARRGDVLAIGKSALNVADDMAHRSELLDYFCLLLAQKLGCRWLDLGLSRAHLDDGVFRYKCKWRPQIMPNGGLRKSIRIYPVTRSPATLAFLRRNGFIERQGERFVVRRLHDGAPHEREGGATDAVAARCGLAGLSLLHADEFFACRS